MLPDIAARFEPRSTTSHADLAHSSPSVPLSRAPAHRAIRGKICKAQPTVAVKHPLGKVLDNPGRGPRPGPTSREAAARRGGSDHSVWGPRTSGAGPCPIGETAQARSSAAGSAGRCYLRHRCRAAAGVYSPLVMKPPPARWRREAEMLRRLRHLDHRATRSDWVVPYTRNRPQMPARVNGKRWSE